MNWKEIEQIFNRASRFIFSRHKLVFTFLILTFCGLMMGCFRTLAQGTNDWVAINMNFLPIFFCSAVLLAAGILLSRIYHHEVKRLPVSYLKTLSVSKDLMVAIAYLAVPILMAYLILWTVLGIFYLLQEIPLIGKALGVIFSFGPFLLLLGTFILGALSILVLFFVTPAVALKSSVQVEILKSVAAKLRFSPLSNLALLFIGILPLVLTGAFVAIAAILTGQNYMLANGSLASSLKWFFLALPFSALLSPAVIFFFNFAIESHVLMVKKMKEEVEVKENHPQSRQ
jgi:hypothetical protein